MRCLLSSAAGFNHRTRSDVTEEIDNPVDEVHEGVHEKHTANRERPSAKKKRPTSTIIPFHTST